MGKGGDDIYFFEELIAPSFDCNQLITGIATDKVTGKLLPNTIVALYINDKKVQEIITGNDAFYRFDNIGCNTKFKLQGTKELYEGVVIESETTNRNQSEVKLNLELQPQKIEIPKPEYVNKCQDDLNSIKNIYFDVDKYYIRPDAAKELDKIVSILNQCTDIKIELQSHTDSRAPKSYNEILSQNRAQSTLDYIVKRGISRDRITAKGFGESQLVNQCSDGVKCTEEEHQQNRRTEFVIID